MLPILIGTGAKRATPEEHRAGILKSIGHVKVARTHILAAYRVCQIVHDVSRVGWVGNGGTRRVKSARG